MSATAHPSGFYVLIGPDRLHKVERLASLAQSLQVDVLDRHELDGSAVGTRHLLAISRQQPVASRRRLIVIDRAHRLATQAIQALLDQASVVTEVACVVFLVEDALSVRHPLALRHALVHTEQFPARDVTAAKPFALTDALGRRDVAGALQALQGEVTHGREPLATLALVSWQLQRWVAMRRLLDAGYDAEAISRMMGWKPWQAQRLRAEVADVPLERAQELLVSCWQAEAAVKQGRVLPALAVEQLVATICLAGRVPGHRVARAARHGFNAQQTGGTGRRLTSTPLAAG